MLATPFAGVKVRGKTRVTPLDTARGFTEGERALIRAIAEGLAWLYGWSEPAAQRLRFLLDFAYATVLRAGELVGARLGDVRVSVHGDHWLHLVGKGRRPGKVALPPLARTALDRYLTQRRLTVTPARWEPKTPFIVSMLESMVEWMGYPLYYAIDNQSPPALSGASHATIYPYGPFPAGDGKTVMLGLQNEREWKMFCERVLEQPLLAVDPRFDANSKRSASRDVLREWIDAAFSKLTAAEVVQRLDAAGIASARMSTLADVWAHPQLESRDRWREVGTSVGPIPALLPPGMPNEFEPRMDPVPALGEHTDAILRELGYESSQIQALREAGTI